MPSPLLPNRRGFSLIEVAIVLTVIGLVVAAIFIATGTVRQKRATNELMDNVLLFSQNVRGAYKGLWYTLGLNTPLNGPAYKAGLTPGSWIYIPSLDRFKSTEDAYIAIWSYGSRFSMTINYDSAFCIMASKRFSETNLASTYGILYIRLVNNTYTNAQFPISDANILSNCNTSNYFELGFQFD